MNCYDNTKHNWGEHFKKFGVQDNWGEPLTEEILMQEDHPVVLAILNIPCLDMNAF
tara:strand:- start:745 stop:912 length:168 start_codon:yes stop_codon:yes gene_type:complete